jgi:protein-S-isoprenylcysteine O-methyltransferase Ste14
MERVRSPSPRVPAQDVKPDSSQKHRPQTAILAGVACVIVGVMLLFLPLLLGRWEFNKYIVVVGFLATCLGLSFFIQGAWDWFRRKR